MEPTYLDINGQRIEPGDIVEWDDGEGTRTAIVKATIAFECIKNTEPNWAIGHTFHMGNFTYSETHKHLRVIKKASS